MLEVSYPNQIIGPNQQLGATLRDRDRGGGVVAKEAVDFCGHLYLLLLCMQLVILYTHFLYELIFYRTFLYQLLKQHMISNVMKNNLLIDFIE